MMCALFLMLLLDTGSMKERIKNLQKGLASEGSCNIILVFLLAGGFSGITRGAGCMQEAVMALIHYLPPAYVICGLFLLTCAASMGLGTSVGIIGLLGPFAMEVAQGNHTVALWCIGAVIGGAAFGDNLSLISDTSIAASQTIGVAPQKKFAANLRVAVWACLGVLAVYIFGNVPVVHYVSCCPVDTISWWKLLPYALVIVVALMGVPVIAALFSITLFTGLINILFTDYTFVSFAQDWQKGMWSMMPITLLTFLLGALQAFIVRRGGVKFLEKKYPKPYIAELIIAKMGVLWTLLFANNTVAILFSGRSVKKIVEKNNLSAANAASVLDIFATATKCVIPHGTQLLLGASFVGCSPISIMPYCLYSFALALSALLFLLVRVNTTHKTGA